MVAARRRAILPAALVVALAAGDARGEGGAARQHVSDTFTTTEPGAPSGRRFAVDFTDPRNPSGKPPAISRVELELAAGARFDTSAVPRCGAADVELVARGVAACPASSRVGIGEITVDTGFPEPARYVANEVTFFNARDELVILIAPRATGARVVLRGRVAGRRLTIDVPPLPGTPPDGGANRRERATFFPSRYVMTPPTCPPTGAWVNRVTYSYRDGVRQTAESRSPCRRAKSVGRRASRAMRLAR